MKLFLGALMLFTMGSSLHALEIGDEVKGFKLEGYPKSVSLDEQKGKFVVLEWYNDGCPFVRKHYDSGNIPNIQKKYQDKISWLTISSSAKGKQGHIENIAKAKNLYTKEQMKSMSLLIDTGGKIGKEFSAKATPHFFILNPQGELIYQGAIDSIASADASDIVKADNYIVAALDEALAGKKVSVAKTQAYGCSVKY